MMTRKSQLLGMLVFSIGGLTAQTHHINSANQIISANGKSAPGQMVTICHQTGNGGSHTITVNENALQAHLNHGDVLGSCEITPPELPNPTPAGCNAVEVVSYIAGTTNDLLTPIEAARQIMTNALGSPEDSDVATPSSAYNFVALGFGGAITLKFANPIHNGAGDDVYVVETTFGNNAQNCARYPEKIRAFASQDNCNWVYMGEGCQNSYFDLQGLAWAQYVKLIDMSRIDYPYGGLADGYDLDGIVCLNGEEANPVPATMSADFATEAMDYLPGTMKNGGAISAARSIKENAVGAPQNTDVVNFVSLGFGGKITLKFGYVVFDKPGADIMLVETSYGNPTCNNYPETARLEVSLDNINWFMLTDSYCQDQPVDVSTSGATMFQYLRITDASAMSSTKFPGTADGFDVDGVVIAQPGCTSSPVARLAAAELNDNVNTANEVAEISVYPNPFNEQLSISLSASNVNETFEVSVINTLGQVMIHENVSVSSESTVRHTLSASTLATGTYLISVRSANSNEVIRAVKF